MILKNLIQNIKPLQVVGTTDVDITGVNMDSRAVEQ